ncbi:MAG: hypothetical protein D6731_04075 [Planctomycetota bacterium]|nr:MAG: hypothetical protein D6731_04075 [Planctomycetota bacterium]
MTSSATTSNFRSKLVDVLASYGLCCVLLLLLFVLTFFGTLEQTELGLYDVQKKYFESLFLVHWLGDLVPVPLPGAYLVLIVLGVNLVLGGVVRMRKTKATLGVLVTHAGILILLLAGFVKLKFSNEGHLTLFEVGRVPDARMTRSDEYVSYHEWEIAIWDGAQERDVKEWIIPDSEFLSLGEGSRTFTSPDLPFDLEVRRVLRNCQALPKGPMWKAAGPVIDGYALRELELARENEQNVAGLYATIRTSSGEETQAILWGGQRYPLAVRAGGRTWAIDLRKRRFKMPFAVALDKFTRELYPGTNMPKVFKSEVTVYEEGAPPTKHLIEMNEPLRHRGLVLFQASWGPANARPGDPLFSTFAVVRNPSDYWPLYACIVISVGMLLAFGRKLVASIRTQAKQRRAAEQTEGPSQAPAKVTA